MKIPLTWLTQYINTSKSPRELADSFTQLGLMLDKIETAPNGELVLDLEHRMDRADWLSVLGCARDLAAFEGTPLRMPELHPADDLGKKPSADQIVNIEVECPDIVHRFNTKTFRGVKVGPSPDWLKTALEAYGIPAINNIVDITNYVMVEFGQPMHAQDLAKLKKQEIVIRRAKAGESLTTLLGESVKLDGDAFVLTQAGEATVIGGIVGGNSTGVDESTTDIVLDAGNYDQNTIRKVSRKLKIQNETVLRYDKFLHPALTEYALRRATKLILELAGGEYYDNIDWYPQKQPLKQQKITRARLKKISGLEFDIVKVRDTLSALEYKILDAAADELTVEVPYFRTDVTVEDDLIADVLRIGNYNTLPVTALEHAPPPEITPAIYTFEEKLRTLCVSLGLDEHITDPLVPSDQNNIHQIKLENALSSEKNALRTSVYQTLLPVVQTYKKHRRAEIGLFELGKLYVGEGSAHAAYKEIRVLEVLYESSAVGLHAANNTLKGLLARILRELGVVNVTYNQAGDTAKILAEQTELGELRLDSFTLYTETLLACVKTTTAVESTVPNIITEDISVTLAQTQNFGDTLAKIAHSNDALKNVYVVDETLLGNNKKSILVRLEFDGQKVTAAQTSVIKAKILESTTNNL